LPDLPPYPANRDDKRRHGDHTDVDEQGEKWRAIRLEEAGTRIGKPEDRDDDRYGRDPTEEPVGGPG